MAKGQKSQLVTKKHLARQQRERLQNRYILIVSVAVIVIVVGLIGYGIVQQYIIQPGQPVAKVADKSITTKQFQTYVRYERVQWIQQYQYYQQLEQYFGSDQSTLSYFQQLMSQIDYQMQPTNLGQSAIDYLVANQIIQDEAGKEGITVSSEEVDTALQDYLGFFPNGTPTPTASSVPVPTSTLNPTQLALVPPTATASPTSTATPAGTITATQTITGTPATATPTIAPTQAISPTATATPSQTNTPTASPTPYTTQVYATNLKQYQTNMKQVADLSESDLRWILTMQLVRQKVYEAKTKDISRQQDEVWARQIVTTDQAAAQTAYSRVTTGGENFQTVATDVMSGTTNTVDLGWFPKGTLESSAESAVWGQKIGDITQPVQTTAGWVIYQVLGHEVRTLNDTDLNTYKQAQFQKFLDEQNKADKVQTFDIWKTRIPTSPTIPPTQATG